MYLYKYMLYTITLYRDKINQIWLLLKGCATSEQYYRNP